ncbi:MAG: DUF5110 domain-containing protein [Myxococcales bacterium]|nr:DUF5110 domain-containing protein [Myxococcales bacterium]USN50632.1 MAG: DUF5110 domain-containing protein [Myxococcales bacterium]
MIILFSSYFLYFLSFSSVALVTNKIFDFHWQGGTRWLKAACIGNGQLHFETFESRGDSPNFERSDADSPIFMSPMLIAAQSCEIMVSNDHEEKYVENDRIKVFIDDDLRCVTIFDKVLQKKTSKICTEKLNEDVKTVFIEKIGMKNAYGVGNLFYSDETNGDWTYRHWDASVRGHGNFRFGHNLGDNFYEGGPSVSQFPMLYLLGEGKENIGLLFDTRTKIGWDFYDRAFEEKNSDSIGWHAYLWDEKIRFIVMGGSDVVELKKIFHELTGYAPVPPKSVFGYWTSEFGYNNWKEIDDELKGLWENNFPIDGIALDLQWFGGSFSEPSSHHMGSLQFHEGSPINGDINSGSFPNPKQNIQRLFNTYGVVVMPIEESYVDGVSDDFLALSNPNERKEKTGFNKFPFENYKDSYLARINQYKNQHGIPFISTWLTTDFRRAGEVGHQVWWGGGGMLDWTHPHARSYWHQLKRHHNARLGIFNFWLDLGEPEMYYAHSYYQGFSDGKNTHPFVHNLYNLLWAQGIFEGFKANQMEMTHALNELRGTDFQFPPRVFTLSRAGTIGSHRYGGMWSGDTFSNFENLRAQANTQMNMSMLGMDYYSSDTGGFFRGDRSYRPQDAFDRSIVTKWAAYSSLVENPMRTHAWALGEDWFNDDGLCKNQSYSLNNRGEVLSNLRNVQRRYELIPYVYSLAHQAHLNGLPIYPPMFFYYQDDLRFRRMANQKMIGEFLLLKMAEDYAQDSSIIELPAGEWFDYESHEHYFGGGRIGPIVFTKQDRRTGQNIFSLPVFAKKGAIIPKMYVDDATMNVYGKRRDNTVRNELIVRIYPSDLASTFTLMEDDGLSTAYLHKNKFGDNNFVRKTQITQHDTEEGVLISIEAAQGGHHYAVDVRKNKLELVKNNAHVQSVELNNNACQELIYESDFPDALQKNLCAFTQQSNLTLIESNELSVFTKKNFKLRYSDD